MKGNMIKKLIILTATIFFALTAQGQNLFQIGQQSILCSEIFKLQSNSEEFYINDLNVLFGKDGEKALLIVSTKTIDVLIRGILIVYLDNGMVITLKDNGINDYVNKIASSVYYLSIEDLNKMKNSNINTIRYILEGKNNTTSPFGGNFSASNKGKMYDFRTLITNFFGI
jgi:hypothetical protein